MTSVLLVKRKKITTFLLGTKYNANVSLSKYSQDVCEGKQLIKISVIQ